VESRHAGRILLKKASKEMHRDTACEYETIDRRDKPCMASKQNNNPDGGELGFDYREFVLLVV